MADQRKEAYTYHFQSADAVGRTPEGGWTFEMKRAGTKAVQATIASMELPISQMSVESEWNRVHFAERWHVTPDARTFRATVQAPAVGGDRRTEEVVVPLAANRVVALRLDGNDLVVRCEFPHGLFVGAHPLVLQWDAWEERVQLLNAPFGDLDVGARADNGQLRPGRDAHEFRAGWDGANTPTLEPVGGWLVAPAPPSPAHFASVLTAGLRHGALGRAASVVYEPEANTFELSYATFPDNGTSVRLAVGGDALLPRLGYATGNNERVFERGRLDPSSLSSEDARDNDAHRRLLQRTQSIDVPSDSGLPLRLPSSPVLWPYVALRPGWYTPSKRVHAATAPQSATREIELQFNRFLLQGREDGGPALVVVDAEGKLRVLPLRVGRFSPDTLAASMTDALTAAAGGLRASFQDERFQFDSASGDTFHLAFNHPASIEAARLGFEPLMYEGRSTYRGQQIDVPNVARNGAVPARLHSNLVGATEAAGRPNVRLVSMAPPPLVAVVRSTRAGGAVLETYSNGREAAHGLHVGQVVRLCEPTTDVEVDGAPLQSFDPKGRRYVVAEVGGVGTFGVHTPVDAAWHIGTACVLRIPVEPTNWHFGATAPRSVGAARLGYEPRAYQHLLDGAFHFEAPFTHDFDHPDYLTVSLLDGKRSTTNVHLARGAAAPIWAKVVIYPTLRDGNQLSRDVVLSSGEDISAGRFTIALHNPDGTVYNFNGASWSFSVILLVVA